MNATMRRVLTVTGAVAGTVALSTGTAFAHYCYRTDVPEGSKMANGSVWATQDEMLAAVPNFSFLTPDCRERLADYIESLDENTLFMGPGLLAGGAVPQGRGPEGMGHLPLDVPELSAPECQEPAG